MYKHKLSPHRCFIWNNDILYKHKSLFFNSWFQNNIILVDQLFNAEERRPALASGSAQRVRPFSEDDLDSVCGRKAECGHHGEKTWFSIPEKNRPLKDRINIGLSRELTVPPTGAHHLAADFSSALRLVDTKLADHADQVWVIGGSSLYKELMESRGTKRLFVTRILKQFDSDTFLPEISPEKYRLLPEFPGVPPELQEENGIQYRFEVYESIEQ
nr:dihydrofolate reductase [Nothobranchius furzeri]